MELRSSKNDEKALEASTVDNNNKQVCMETEKERNEVAETSLGENNKANQKCGEAHVVVNNQDEKASEALIIKEDEKEYGKVEEVPDQASVKAEASEKKTPVRLKAKTKPVKARAKKLVKRKRTKGTPVLGVNEKNEITLQGDKEGTELDSTMANDKEDEKVSEAYLGESDKEVNEGSATVPESSSGDEEDAEASVEAEPSEKKMPKGLKARTKITKTRARRFMKAYDARGTPCVQTVEESETLSQGAQEGMKLDLVAANNNENEKDAENSPGGNKEEVENVAKDSVEAPENAWSAKKKTPKWLKAKTKAVKIPATQPAKADIENSTSQFEENTQEKHNSLLDGNNEGQRNAKMNATELSLGEERQQKSTEEDVEKNKQNQSTQVKPGLTGDGQLKGRKCCGWVLGQKRKLKKEPAVTGIQQANELGGSERVPDSKEKQVIPKKTETNNKKKEKLGGLIFMCNAKTKPDCFHFRVMGVTGNKKDLVMGIKPGLKLFLYDYDLKLLYGIFQAASSGGMKLERKAFGGSFPAQVRFKVIKDCNPLPESEFRKAIKENYNNKNKFKTELTLKQVFKLKKLFRPAVVPSATQLIHTRPALVAPVARDSGRKRSANDHHAPSSSRTSTTHKRERDRHPRMSPPPPRREEPRDLYLSEREYRAYGLKRVERSPHYPIPPDSYYRDLDRGHVVALDAYHRDLDRDRLLRHADIGRPERREPQPLHHNPLYLSERGYRSYDHLNARRELVAPQEPPISSSILDRYTRDPYYTYVAERPSRTYLGSSGREDGLYSRYAAADTLADYYQTRQYQRMADDVLPSSSAASLYAVTGHYDSYR